MYDAGRLGLEDGIESSRCQQAVFNACKITDIGENLLNDFRGQFLERIHVVTEETLGWER